MSVIQIEAKETMADVMEMLERLKTLPMPEGAAEQDQNLRFNVLEEVTSPVTMPAPIGHDNSFKQVFL